MEAIQVTLPSSKSISNRWLALDYLSSNGIKIKNLSSADDTQLFKRLLRQMKMGRRHTFDCRDAGTAARFITALLAFTPGTHVVTGSEYLCKRPMAPLIEALRSIGCQIKCQVNEGFLPLQIEGVMPTASRLKVDGSMSSQFVSALLLAAISLPHGLAIELEGDVASEPYIRMTLDMMTRAGVQWALKGNPPAYHVEHNIPQCDAVVIEKDWSAASCFYGVAALRPGCRLHMSGLAHPSLQGDCVAMEIFERLGVVSANNGLAMEIERTGKVADTLEYDFTDTPDLVPAVAVACAGLGVEARLSGIANLRLKESDRVASIVTELSKMGCNIEATEDMMCIHPSQLVVSQPVDPHGAHRIAMSFAMLRAIFPQLEILHPEVVSKSFPTFFEMLGRALA